MEITAAGMDVANVRPTFRPRYTLAAVKSSVIRAPRKIPRQVSSSRESGEVDVIERAGSWDALVALARAGLLFHLHVEINGQVVAHLHGTARNADGPDSEICLADRRAAGEVPPVELRHVNGDRTGRPVQREIAHDDQVLVAYDSRQRRMENDLGVGGCVEHLRS